MPSAARARRTRPRRRATPQPRHAETTSRSRAGSRLTGRAPCRGDRFLSDPHAHHGARMTVHLLTELTIFILAVFVGVEVISKVPTTLHTPLMSATNAIHGIVLVGAILVAGTADAPLGPSHGLRAGRAGLAQRLRRLHGDRTDAADVPAQGAGAQGAGGRRASDDRRHAARQPGRHRVPRHRRSCSSSACATWPRPRRRGWATGSARSACWSRSSRRSPRASPTGS